MGAGASIGQLFQFILSSVSMREVGSASGVLEATQQLSTSLGVAVLGTIFLSGFGHHLPTHALEITAWACLVPIAIAFAKSRTTELVPLGLAGSDGAIGEHRLDGADEGVTDGVGVTQATGGHRP